MAKILIDKKARKFLEKLEKRDRDRIEDKLRELADGVNNGVIPPYLDVRKLKGKLEGYLRVRVGVFRIIFRLDVEKRLIIVVKISRRKRAYR